MKKLIKISDIHYIIVDDSKIKEGDFVYGGLNGNDIKQYGKYFADDWQKITYSTQPLGFLKEEGITTANLKHDWTNTKKLSLQECEELTQGYSVEKMADEYVTDESYLPVHKEENYRSYINGFNAHKELVKDKFILTKGQLDDIINYARAGKIKQGWDYYIDYEYTTHQIIESLLPKTEWEIEIDENNKMRLI